MSVYWQGLIDEIKPIPAEQLLLFVGIERGLSALQYPQIRNANTRIQDQSNHRELITRLQNIEANMGKQNSINIHGSTISQLAGIGDNTSMTQYNNAPEAIISADNRAELALSAIQQLHKERTLSGQQRLQLSELEIQIEANTANNDIYTTLGMDIGTVANIATIGGTIVALLGLA